METRQVSVRLQILDSSEFLSGISLTLGPSLMFRYLHNVGDLFTVVTILLICITIPTLRLLLFGTAKWKDSTWLPSFFITMFPKNCPGVNQNGNKGGSFSWYSAWILLNQTTREDNNCFLNCCFHKFIIDYLVKVCINFCPNYLSLTRSSSSLRHFKLLPKPQQWLMLLLPWLFWKFT